MPDLQALLSQMTLDEKIGQLSQLNVRRYAEMVEVEITDEDNFTTEKQYSKHLLGSRAALYERSLRFYRSSYPGAYRLFSHLARTQRRKRGHLQGRRK